MAVVICCFAGCNLDHGAWVYIDNGSETAIQVELDGVQVAEIGPGEFERIAAKSGERQFKITGAGETVFEGNKTIEKAESFFVPKRYLFNPDDTNNYWMYKVYYGQQSVFEKVTRSDRNEHEIACNEICGEYELMPAADWITIPSGAFVLTDAPDQIVMKQTQSVAERNVLARVSEENYRILEQAKTNGDATEEDLVELIDTYNTSMID